MTPRESILVLALAGALFPACYSPDLRDCAVTCSAAGDCADGLDCGSDGFCHPPGATDMCTQIDGGDISADANTTDADPTAPDADPTAPDANSSMPDALVAADAPSGILLEITVAGPGRVQALADGINCNSTCQYYFDAGTQLTLTGVPNNMNFTFNGWMGDECAGETTPCTFTLNVPTSIAGSFSN